MKVFIYIVILVVALAIIAGFFIVGSPYESRVKKFDEQRVGNLQTIQREIINFWTKKGELPKTLFDLKDDIRGFSIPIDPENGEQYDYKVKDKYTFSLCANFGSATFVMTSNPKFSTMRPREEGYLADDWQHFKGIQCFERVIDPELYQVNKLMPNR